MQMLRRWQLLLVLLALITSGVRPVFAASVTFRAATVQAQAGGSIDVPIEAVAAPSLGALHLELAYDPKVLTPDTVTRGPLAGSNALVDFNPATAGRVLIGVVSLDAIKGDGALATVRFKVIGDAGTSSALTLDNSKAWESGTHAEVLVKTEAGKVTVGGGLPLWLFAAVGVIGLLLLFLIFFLLMRRRRPALQPAMVQPYMPPGPAAPPAYYAPPAVATTSRPGFTAPPAAPPASRPGFPAATPPPTLPGQSIPPASLGLPERPAPAGPAPSSDAFKQTEDQYFALKGRLAAGRITHEQFEAALKDLMIRDPQGRYWMLGVDSGKWFVHNGQTWVEGQPF